MLSHDILFPALPPQDILWTDSLHQEELEIVQNFLMVQVMDSGVSWGPSAGVPLAGVSGFTQRCLLLSFL